MKRSMIRLFSVILSVMMIISNANFIVTAEGDPEITENTQANESTNEIIYTQELTEDVSLRDKFTKHYAVGDGKRYAVVFSEQVHYEDENGAWQEVDNTLTYDESSAKYQTNNAEGGFTASFSPTVTQNGELVSVTDGEYTVSWSVSFAGTGNMQMSANATAQIVNVGANISEIKTVDNMKDIGKAASSVRYNSVYGSADLRYSVAYGRVEEDIILNSASGFTGYVMTVNTGGLTAIKNSDGSVSFNNAEGEAIFNIDAPWMKDANNAYSNAIAVDVFQRGNVAYIGYTPDAEWLSADGRQYPVLIDPSFTTRTYSSNYEDAYITYGESGSVYDSPILKIGTSDSGDESISYIRIFNFPDITSSITVENVTFNMYTYYEYPCAPTNLQLLIEDWSAEDIEYDSWEPVANAQLFLSASPAEIDFGEYYEYSFDLKDSLEDYVYNWNNTHSYNYGNVLEFLDSEYFYGFKLTGSGYSEVYSSENSDMDHRPTITIQYSYTTPAGIMDGGVYSFKNVYSSKYLTVHGGNTSDNTNVNQKAKDNTRSQAFRLSQNVGDPEYPENSEATYGWLIKTMCDESNNGFALTQRYQTTVNDSVGYSPSNVFLHEYYDVPTWQEWLIIPVGIHYKIVSMADPNLALTSYGTGNGTADGTTATSAGNVFVAPYTGALNQLWIVESGDVVISNTVPNIAAISDGTIYSMPNNGYITYFLCPVTEFSHTIEWSSSNEEVAVVDEFGKVTSKLAGMATIMATDSEDPDTEYSVNIRVYFGSGRYFFENSKEGNYMQIDDSDVLLDSLAASDCDQWFLQYLGNGYYTIASAESGLVLSVASAKQSTPGASIIQETNIGEARKKWKIERIDESGTYTISSAVEPSFYVQRSGSNIVQNYETDDNSDEWGVYLAGSLNTVDLYGQQSSKWCWVACARMFAKSYYSPITYSQSQAVTQIKGSIVDIGGSKEEAVQAINYFISSIEGASINLVIKNNEIYSESVMKQFLDGGHVIYVARGIYNDFPNRNDGHAVLITGYCYKNGKCWFVMQNPAPMFSGKISFISYEKLVNSANPYFEEQAELTPQIWDGSIVVNTSYSGTTIPYYWDQ